MIVLLLKITFLLGLALVSQPLLRRSSAAIRHVVCACALAGVLILPLTMLAPPESNALRIDTSAVVRASGAVISSARSGHLLGGLAGLWAFGSALLFVRIAVGYRALAMLLRKATRIERCMDHCANHWGGAGTAVPVFSADINVPVASGLFRPVILLPRAAHLWNASQRRAALQHELQHIERKDLWTMLIGEIACALYWFHPLAWAVARRSRLEQESACDDAVLATGFEPASYAEALVAVAHQINSTRLIGCHMLTRKTLKFRIARLFDDGQARIPSRAHLRGTAAVSAAAIILVGMLAGAARAGDQEVYKSGNGVSAPSVLSKTDPEYTTLARDEKVDGTVLLSLVIGPDGLAHDINVVKGIGAGLDEKAVEAIQKWHFRPGMKDGEPVSVRAQIEVNFRLM